MLKFSKEKLLSALIAHPKLVILEIGLAITNLFYNILNHIIKKYQYIPINIANIY